MEHHALQCGFCTPAMLMTAQEFLRDNAGVTDERAIREAISGVTCRCTGYQQIVEAIQSVAARA
jgi:aerobic-type carbon monoxide dehydrogenase small subunit (CoxS/CutS family)